MKRMVQWFAFLVSACAACAQGTLQVVVPSGLANVEGNTSTSDLFSTTPRQMVQVYAASEFGLSAGTTGLISSASFRLDGATAQSFGGVWPSATIYLSTTTRTPDSLSPILSDNVGGDAIQVFGGSLVIRATNTGVSPRMFEILMQFTTPFYYDPARGNLSMYILTTSGPTNLILDAEGTFGDSVGRVYGPAGPNSGTVDSVGLVTRFGITPVPEPKPVIIALLMSMLTIALRHRKRTCKRHELN